MCSFFKKKEVIFGLVLTILTFVLLLFTLSDYGVNWDEPIHYIRGQAFLRFFLTGKDNYDDLPKLKFHYPKVVGRELPTGITYEDDKIFRRSIYQYSASKSAGLTFAYFVSDIQQGHPPLNGILASFFNYLFYQKLGWLGDIEAYHLFIITVTSFAILSIFLFTSFIYGMFAGLIAVISIVLYPLFFSESHFNIKDPVEMAFYTFSVITFYFGITKQNWKLVLLSGVFAGFALGTKLNILFAFFTVAPWLAIYKWNDVKRFKWPFSRRITFSMLMIPFIALAVLFGTWPYLWVDPLNHFLSFISYYRALGSTSYQAGNDIIIFGINTYAIQWIIYTTPLITLFLSACGIIYFFTKGIKEKEKTSLLIFFWLLVPIVRVAMPNAGIYGGVRQIMEYIPPLAILSGIGAYYVIEKLRWNHMVMKQLLILLSFIPIALKLISIHPNENVYFNPLIGGLKGASARNFPDWGTTLGSPYKRGIDWINKYAEEGSEVALVNGFLSNIPRIFIRSDIYFSELHYSGEKKDEEYLMEVTGYQWDLNIPEEKKKYLETLVPVYEEKVDGVAILKIWKNDKQHTRN